MKQTVIRISDRTQMIVICKMDGSLMGVIIVDCCTVASIRGIVIGQYLWPEAIGEVLREPNKVAAIKRVREISEVGLYVAKEFVENAHDWFRIPRGVEFVG